MIEFKILDDLKVKNDFRNKKMTTMNTRGCYWFYINN